MRSSKRSPQVYFIIEIINFTPTTNHDSTNAKIQPWMKISNGIEGNTSSFNELGNNQRIKVTTFINWEVEG